jgi:hypothetical protein
MLSSGAGLGVARYLLDMVKYNQKEIPEDEYRGDEVLRCGRTNVESSVAIIYPLI